jgi:hypothetical protein
LLVEAAGVEFERSASLNFLMARDFWCYFVDVAAVAAARRLHGRPQKSSMFDPIRGGILEAAGRLGRRQSS